MKKIILVFFLTFSTLFYAQTESSFFSKTDAFLNKYVKNNKVNYEAIKKNSDELTEILKIAADISIDDESVATQKAFWINAYNAFTIKLICDHYPVQSIKDIKKGVSFVSDTWTIDFIKIEGKMYNLNNIEHGILRPKYNDPRIHAAVNCASRSCPKLLNESFKAEKLDEQLDMMMKSFINDPTRNKITSSKKAELSKIFTWFAGDFKKSNPSVIAFINKYSTVKIDKNADISYLDYNWQLNKQ